MKKKIFSVFVCVLFGIMLITPVLAIGPIKPNQKEKNKNNYVPYPNAVWQFTDHGLFQEWFDDGETRYRLMRKNASICNIGGAVDASGWTFPPYNPGYCFWMLLTAESRWVYVDPTGMANLLTGFGMPPPMVAAIVGMHPDGAYYKADMVGN